MKSLAIVAAMMLLALPSDARQLSLSIDSEWTLPVTADPQRPFADGHSGARTVVGPHDLDGDGKIEIFVSDYTGGGRAHMMEYSPGAGWQHVASTPWLDNSTSTGDARVIAAGDMDGDGVGEIYILTGFDFDAASPYPPGLFVFEMTGDNTFPAVPTYIHDFLPNLPNRWRAEQMTIQDIDGDGRQELMFANNDSNNEGDNWWVLSFTGDIGSGSESVVTELRLSSRDAQAFDPVNRGGGSPYGAVPANLDGTGGLELALQSWNGFNFTNVGVTGANSYAAPGAADPNIFLHASPTDDVAFFGCRAYDLDGNGDDEVLCPNLQTGNVSVLNYEPGENPLEVTPGNIGLNVVPGLSSLGLVVTDLDGNGQPDLIGAANSYSASDYAGGASPTWFNLASYSGGNVESSASYSALTTPVFQSARQFSFQTVRFPDGSQAFENGPEGPIFASKFTSLGDVDGDGKNEFAVSFQGVEDFLNVFDDDGSGNRALASSSPNPHRTFLRIMEAGTPNPVSVAQINAILPANITQLNSEGAALDTGALPSRVFNDLVGTTVVFDAVVMTDPLSSGLASSGGGGPGRLHVFVRDITGSSGLGQDSRGVQLVDGNYQGTGLINASVGDVIRVDAVVSPFGTTMQLAPNSITLLGTASGMGMPPNLMDPILVATGDINESLPPGLQANWDRLADLRGEFVRIENAEVVGVNHSLSRPAWEVSTDGGLTSVAIDVMSLRFRNDRSFYPGEYPPSYNLRVDEFQPPAVGSIVNLQGFLSMRGQNPFGRANPGPAMLSIAPFSDGDLEIVSEVPPAAGPPYPAEDDFLIFVDARNLAIPQLSAQSAEDPDDASNQVVRFPQNDWAQTGFQWDAATGADLSPYIGSGAFDGSSLFLRLRASPDLQGRNPVAISFFDSNSGAQGPRADLESGAATGDLQFRARWYVPERYRDGQWHDLEIPLPPPTQAGLRSAQFGRDPQTGATVGAPLDDLALHWEYGGAWAGGFGVWDDSDPLWREFQWDRVSLLGVHYDFADGGGGEVFFDDVYIGAPAADLSPLATVASTVDFEVDITPLELIGLFDESAGDAMEVRGGFNGWNCNNPALCEMTSNGAGRWTLSAPFLQQVGTPNEFKFFANLDAARFSPDPPPPGWEEPAESGGANRLFTYSGNGQVLEAEFFSDYLPGNVIPDGIMTDAVFRVDMNGAPGFDPGQHTVWAFIGQDGLWAYTQGIGFGEPLPMDDLNGDGVFEVTFPVSGPTFGGIQYTYGFGTDPLTPVDSEQGAGFSGPGRKRLRWISPGQQGYPASFDFPVDVFQPAGALPVEDNPLEILAVDDNPNGLEDTPLTIHVLANDVDPLALGLTITGVTAPQTGTVEVPTSAAGIVIYRSPPEFSGTDVFTYTMADASGQEATGTVNVTIGAVNDPPNAVPDLVTTNKGVALTFSPIVNDTDIEGDTVALVSVDAPAGGSISVTGSSVTYTPNAGFSGSDSFEYVITDGATTARGAIIMTVNDVNVAPVAMDDTAATTEETSVSVSVLANDSDADVGDILSIVSVTTPANGTATDNGDGTITYTPAAQFEGTDQFSYTIEDPEHLQSTATVVVAVTGVNDPPVASDDTRVAFSGIAASYDVLSNDTDADGDALTIMSVSTPSNGTTAIVGGRVTYSPGGATMATDMFTYTISDSNGGSDTATVTVSVEALPADDDGVEEAIEAAAPNGGDGNNDGIPDSEQANVASLPSATTGAYLSVASDPGSEIVGVTSSPDPPSPPEDPPPAEASFQTGFLNFELRGGTGNAAKTVTITASEPFNTYYKYGPTPDNMTPHWYQFLYDGETGAVINGNTMTLHFVDGKRGDDDLTANGIIVDPGAPALIPNELPIAGPDLMELAEDSSVQLDLLLNDSDGDGDMLSIASIGTPTNGTATLIGSTVTYTPAAEFSGSDSFEYVLSDGRGGTVTGTVTVTVTSVNDPPVANADVFTTKEDTAIMISTLLDNDTDAEGSALSIVRVFAADEGLVTYGNDGSIRYTPAAEFSGEDRFSYSISDGTEEGVPGEVLITVSAVNDAPTVGADFLTLEGGETSVSGNVLTNDSDVDSATITVTAVGAATAGTVTFTADGTVTYTPGAGFGTSDSFSYTVTDVEGASSDGVVNVALGAVAPTAEADAASTAEDAEVTIEVLANDSDPNGDDMTIISVGDPAHGSAAVNAEGQVVYMPNDDYNGTDSFTYTVSDGGLESTATVTVTIAAVDDAPRFAEDSPVFVAPANGVTVPVGTADPESPAGRLETIVFEFNGATDPEGAGVTYTWDLSMDEDLATVLVTQALSETSFSLLTSAVADLMSDNPGDVLTVYHRITASDGELETASAIESATLIRGYITGVDDEAIPEDFELHQNYPNPFNPRTTIKYAVPQSGKVSIVLFDALGRKVATLLDEQLSAGYHHVAFDASRLPSGLYIYVMRAEGFLQSKGMILMR